MNCLLFLLAVLAIVYCWFNSAENFSTDWVNTFRGPALWNGWTY